MFVPMSAELDSDIGLFWDVRDSFFPSCSNPVGFAQDLLLISRAFCAHQSYNCAKVFGMFSRLEFFDTDSLNAIGFEAVELASFNCSNTISTAILLWLWDCERVRKDLWNPCLVLVTSDHSLLPLLENLRKRNVYLVLIIDDTVVDRALWTAVGNVILNLHEVSSDYITHREESPLVSSMSRMAPSSLSTALPGHESNSNHQIQTMSSNSSYGSEWNFEVSPKGPSPTGPSPNFDFQISDVNNMVLGCTLSAPMPMPMPSRANTNTIMNISNSSDTPSPPHMAQPFGDEIGVMKDEQRQLQDELLQAFAARNTQVAVSTLRKIYTKQYKSFRIPSLLLYISQQFENIHVQNRVVSTNGEIIFILGCIQWCFGGQKGDNVESFTYKMNKNIARWLIKDIQRRNFPPPLPQELVVAAITVVQNILKQIAEFEISLEVLVSLHVTEPMNVLTPYIMSWGNSINPIVAHRVRAFAKDIGIPSSMFGHVGNTSGGSSGGGGGSGNTNNNMGYAMDHMMMANTTSSKALGPGSGPYSSSPRDRDRDRMMYSQDIQRSASVGSQPQSQMQPQEFSYATLHEEQQYSYNSSVSRSYGPPGTASTDPVLVSQRLMRLLQRAPHGILGARIPDIYAAEFCEPLNLQNKKLKDLLLGLEGVEMTGLDGPGDKLFRLTNRGNVMY